MREGRMREFEVECKYLKQAVDAKDKDIRRLYDRLKEAQAGSNAWGKITP